MFFIFDGFASSAAYLISTPEKRLVCTVILTRVDYCNSALVGLSESIRSGTIAASTLRGRVVCLGLAATGPHHH